MDDVQELQPDIGLEAKYTVKRRHTLLNNKSLPVFVTTRPSDGSRSRGEVQTLRSHLGILPEAVVVLNVVGPVCSEV